MSSENREGPNPTDPPEAWPFARAAARRLLSPVERFLSVEASSGVLLLLAAVVALVWANSTLRASYEALWRTPIGLRVGSFEFQRDLRFWINDGLMVIFFFVVGLEIRREVHRGELSDLRRAALPLLAALGGMVVPACLYLAANAGTAAVRGWGVPMATDIAFAVGVLALLGGRVQPGLRILLLALAVIDDLGAIIVIAVFYSNGLNLTGLGVAGGGLLLLLSMQKLGVRSPFAYLFPGAIVWAGIYGAGIHPTLAGVIMGLATPVRAWLGAGGFVAKASATVEAVRLDGGDRLAHRLASLDLARREALSPVDRQLHALHPWVAFVIMPVFALANAGVVLDVAGLRADGTVLAGVLLGLTLGKPVGVLGFSWVAVRLRLVSLPTGIGWREMLVLGVVAGIGFTMALFIAALALPPGPTLELAKLGILGASVIAGAAGLGLGRLLLPVRAGKEGATTIGSEAGLSTNG